MTDRVDCQVFEDQLDSLVRGELEDEYLPQLQRHAAGCPECGTLLRVQQHLVTPSLEALEAQVPERWVSSMWGDVQRALGTNRTRVWAFGRWMAPLLAAATLVLMFSGGVTLQALRRSEARAATLTEQVLDQQRRLTALEQQGSPGSSRGVGLSPRGAWVRSLEARGDLTVADLRGLLRELPAGTTLFLASRTRALAGSRLVPSPWRQALARLDPGKDLTVGELLSVLDHLDLPADARVPTSRLIELVS